MIFYLKFNPDVLKKYPLISTPTIFNEYFERDFFIGSKPQKRRYNIPPPDKKKYELSGFSTFIQIILGFPLAILAIMLVVGVIPSLISGEGDMGDYFFPIFISVVILSIIEYKIHAYEEIKSEEYGAAKRNYFEDKFQYEKKQEEEHKKEIEDYNNLKNHIDNLDDIEFKKFVQRWYYAKYLTYPTNIEGIRQKSEINLSISNEFKKYFGENINDHLALKVTNQNTNRKIDYSYYLPDVYYYNQRNNFSLVIQIGVNNDHGAYREFPITYDYKFTGNNWFLIRFYEEQLENDFENCVSIVRDLIINHDPDFTFRA